MTTEREPRTEAGRRLMARMERYDLWHPIDGRRDDMARDILAIEAEARAEAAREALEAVGHDLDADVDCRCTRFAATTWGSKP